MMNHRPTRLSILRWIATAGAGLLVATFIATPAQAAVPTSCGNNFSGYLDVGEWLCAGYEVGSVDWGANAPYTRAIMQTDGNFVSYDQWGHALHVLIPGWGAGYFVVMQTDGNMCMYNASGGYVKCSDTGGQPGSVAQSPR